ncbi:MAG: type IX secretion system membrane protein PorP/SprF [Spirosomataceae bacterium]
MPKRLLTLCCFLLCSGVWAQQKPHYSQYMMNGYLLNPALSGIEDYMDVKTGYRNQWSGFGGEPTTFYLSAHGALNKPDRTSVGALPVRGNNGRRIPKAKYNPYQVVPGHHGVGMMLVSDKTGPTSRTSFALSYAYHLPLRNGMKLSLGASGGLTQHTLDFDKITLANPVDPVTQQGKVNTTQPDVNIGAWLYTRQWYVGASANQILAKKLDFTGNQGSYQWLGQLYTHYFVTAGYRAELSEDWAFSPSVMVKYVRPTPLSFDINAKLFFRDRFWFGGSYRHKDAVVGLVGFNVNYLINIGYSYDYVLSSINTVAKGSHEVVIGIMLNNKQRILCPVHMW